MLTELVQEIILSSKIGVKNDDICVLAIYFAQLLAPVWKSCNKHINRVDHDRCYRPLRNSLFYPQFVERSPRRSRGLEAETPLRPRYKVEPEKRVLLHVIAAK